MDAAIACPVAWCDGDDLDHGRTGELDFHMSEKIIGPMFLFAYLVQLEGEPIKLEIEAEYTGTESPGELRDFSAEAGACAAWLLEQADKLDQLNMVAV